MEKNFALGATKKNNILTLVLSKKKFWMKKKKHNPPPFKLNGRSLSEIDLWFIGLLLSPFLNAGQTLAYLQSSGILPVLSDKLNNVVKIGAICVVHSLSILPCILSGPDALWIFIFCNNLLIPFSVMIILGTCISMV